MVFFLCGVVLLLVVFNKCVCVCRGVSIFVLLIAVFFSISRNKCVFLK